jgi:hypothetical protein
MSSARTIVCLTLAACGGTNGGGDDDDQTATTPDVTVKVHVTEAGAPVGNAKVFASTTDGEVATELATDATGAATITVPGGGFVTALWQDAAGDYRAYSVSRASDGEDAPLEIDAAMPATGGTGTINASFGATEAGADSYDATDGCDSQGLPGTLATSNACAQPDGTFAILARAWIHVGGQYPPQGRVAGYQLAQHVAQSGTAPLAGPWIPGGDLTITMNEAPAGVQSVTARTGWRLGTVLYPELAQTFTSVAPSSSHTLNASGPSFDLGLTSLEVTYEIAFAPTGGRTETSVVVKAGGRATDGAQVTNLSMDLLPRIHDPVLDQDVRHHYRVTFVPDGTPTMGSYAELTWTDAGGKQHAWLSRASSVPIVSFPAIPGDAASWAAPDDATAIQIATVRIGGFGGSYSESKL